MFARKVIILIFTFVSSSTFIIPVSPTQTEECDLELLNLEDVVKKYAESFLDSDKKKRADLDHPVINWSFMHITHGETQYVQSTDYAEPTAHALFTANFTNNTPHPQTYALRTERRTKSTCSVSFKRAYTFGSSLSLSLSPPTPVIGASVGFRRDVCRERGVTESSEQELSWSVDNQIHVPSGFQTKAELIIKEDKYTGDFTIPCTFEGKVIVTYQDKDTKDHLKTVSASVKRFFENSKEFGQDNRNRIVFIVRGVCKCKYGIEQNVSLVQTRIEGFKAADAPDTTTSTTTSSTTTTDSAIASQTAKVANDTTAVEDNCADTQTE